MLLTRSIQMRERSSNNNGVITVYLTFMLLVMLSFLFTSIEAARIEASKAYLVMLSEMASKSLKGMYYYPLFEEYGLLGVDIGNFDAEEDTEFIKEFLCDKLSYSSDNTFKGLINIEDPDISAVDVGTLVTSRSASFKDQIRSEALYEGADLLMSGLRDSPELKSASDMGELTEKQEETMKAAEEAARELLKLMHAVDGIAVSDLGFKGDRQGKIYCEDGFLKSFGIKDEKYMRGTYGNTDVYEAAKGFVEYPMPLIEETLRTIESYRLVNEETERLNLELSELNDKEDGLLEDLDFLFYMIDIEEVPYEDLKDDIDKLLDEIKEIEEQKQSLSEEIERCEKELKKIAASVKDGYEKVSAKINKALGFTDEARTRVLCFKEKQDLAREASASYRETVSKLNGTDESVRTSLSGEAAEFERDTADDLLCYDADMMLETLSKNKGALLECVLPAFSKDDIRSAENALKKAREKIPETDYSCFCFKYGDIKPEKGTEVLQTINKTLDDLLGGSILSLIGVTDISECKLTGVDLLSEESETSGALDVIGAFHDAAEFLSENDMGNVISAAFTGFTDMLSTEVYLCNNFSDYGNPKDKTKIRYEREYVLFGALSDSENLKSSAVRLLGLRTVFTYGALLADQVRMKEAEAVGALVAGATGIAPLMYVIKYAILTLWAVEEALVEVCALFKGLKADVFSKNGNVSFAELFVMTKELIQKKAGDISAPEGATYGDYISFLSFFKDMSTKNNRIMDLIQENIRYRFKDSFRIKNVLTSADIRFSAGLVKKFDTAFFKDEAYTMRYETSLSY